MADNLTFAPVVELVDAIKATGLQASQDPSDLNMPGAWVTVTSIGPSTLAGGWEIQCQVYLIVADQDHARASKRLAQQFNKLMEVITPDGPVIPQGVLMPGDPTPLPALRVPVNLYT